MDRKSFISKLVVLFIMIGIGFVLSLFIFALRMPASAGEHFIHVPVNSIEDNKLNIIDSGEDMHNYYRVNYLLLKFGGDLSVLRVFTHDHKYVMPWHSFWDRAWLCSEIVLKNELIICGDGDLPDEYKGRWAWDHKGINHGSDLSDLEVIPYKAEGQYIVIGKR